MIRTRQMVGEIIKEHPSVKFTLEDRLGIFGELPINGNENTRADGYEIDSSKGVGIIYVS